MEDQTQIILKLTKEEIALISELLEEKCINIVRCMKIDKKYAERNSSKLEKLEDLICYIRTTSEEAV